VGSQERLSATKQVLNWPGLPVTKVEARAEGRLPGGRED
jgi:hypothetical protein